MAILEIIGGITGMLQNRVRNNVEASETHFASKNFKISSSEEIALLLSRD